MDSPLVTLAPFLFVGFMILFAIIFVPMMIRRTRKKQKEAKDFLPALCRKTGLTPTSDGATGNYKGYHVTFRSNLGANIPLIAESYMRGDGNQMYGRQTFYPVVFVELRAPGANFPDIALYQPMSVLRTHQKIMDFLHDREPKAPELNMEAKSLHRKAKFFGTDSNAARHLLHSAELQNLLKTWIYPDIRAEGDRVTLELNNNNILNEFGSRLSSPDYIIQAIDIAVAFANALKKSHPAGVG